jgi:hypothetical protein
MTSHPGWHTVSELDAALSTSNIANRLNQLRKWGMVEHDGKTPKRWKVVK